MEKNENDEDLLVALYTEYMEIMSKIEEEELQLTNVMEVTQNKFTKKYNMTIGENPLQDQIDEANEELRDLETLINN